MTNAIVDEHAEALCGGRRSEWRFMARRKASSNGPACNQGLRGGNFLFFLAPNSLKRLDSEK
jgi:hypothetical protein